MKTHEGPCCISCLTDIEDYPIYDENWERLCCCLALREPA